MWSIFRRHKRRWYSSAGSVPPVIIDLLFEFIGRKWFAKPNVWSCSRSAFSSKMAFDIAERNYFSRNYCTSNIDVITNNIISTYFNVPLAALRLNSPQLLSVHKNDPSGQSLMTLFSACPIPLLIDVAHYLHAHKFRNTWMRDGRAAMATDELWFISIIQFISGRFTDNAELYAEKLYIFSERQREKEKLYFVGVVCVRIEMHLFNRFWPLISAPSQFAPKIVFGSNYQI